MNEGVPQLREAIDKFEAMRTPDGMYGSEHDAIVAAVRCLVEVAETSQEVLWCETHGYEARPACWNSVGTPEEGHGRICSIVPRRLVDPQLLPGGDR